MSWLSYDTNKTKSENADEHLYKLNTLQDQTATKLQKLQLRVDSISNLPLAKQIDTRALSTKPDNKNKK